MKTEISNERFSIFPCGWKREDGKVIMHQHQQQTQTISWVYERIRSPWWAMEATVGYRAMLPTATKEEKNAFKQEYFQYATFSGIFPYRKETKLVMRTPFLTLDFDDLGSLVAARAVQLMLCLDTKIDTVLCFISPSGEGVKWIIRLPEWTDGKPFKVQFDMIRDYVSFNYGLDADKTGSDVCRACYLPWDNLCFVNPKYVKPYYI